MTEKHFHIRRIRALYTAVPDPTRRRGRHWYAREHAYALDLSRRTHIPIRLIAACLSVLSPRCQWPRVKAACEELAAGGTPAGIFTQNVRKARAILASGAVPIHPREAPKTWSFWRNLWRPADPEPVTLDSWMFRAHALPVTSGIRAYETLADAYREAARQFGLIPNQLQAMVWLQARAR